MPESDSHARLAEALDEAWCNLVTLEDERDAALARAEAAEAQAACWRGLLLKPPPRQEYYDGNEGQPFIEHQADANSRAARAAGHPLEEATP